MKEPFLYKGHDPIDWSFGQVADLVQDAMQLGCLSELVSEADREGLVVRVPPDAVNFVKKYLFHHGYHKSSEKARGVIVSAACIPSPSPPGPMPPVSPPPGPGERPRTQKEVRRVLADFTESVDSHISALHAAGHAFLSRQVEDGAPLPVGVDIRIRIGPDSDHVASPRDRGCWTATYICGHGPSGYLYCNVDVCMETLLRSTDRFSDTPS